MENTDYKRVVTFWKELKIPEALPRETKVNLDVDMITTVSGPRRAGKTYFCFYLIHALLTNNVPEKNILYVNFEDNKLLGATAEDLEKIFETYLELYEPDTSKKVYLFLDEIQVVKNWDAWARKMYDTEKKITLVLTGSSSKLLSREISTRLRGRVINKEIFPLSFKEMLAWKDIRYNVKTIAHSKNRIQIKRLFTSYLKGGGYPAVVSQKVERENLLQNYYDSMIFKDVVERYTVEDVKKLQSLANLLFSSVAHEISYNRLANKLHSIGFTISTNTIIEYISHFEDAYLFFQNLKYEYSLAKQLGSIKKVYCIDNGLLNSVSFKFSKDSGKLMENLVFLQLRRNNSKIFYHRKEYECDFLVVSKSKVVSAIQVTQKIDDHNEKREINGLLEVMREHDRCEGIILTEDQDEERKVNGRKITIIPVWRWLLEQ